MSASLARRLAMHECESVVRLGWRGIKNGSLLGRAESSGFQVLITLDDDMAEEQNMANRSISILILKPRKQGKVAIGELAGRISEALLSINPGEIKVVKADTLP